jgi:hypothetical protein
MSAKVGDTIVIESGVAISKSEQGHTNVKSDGGSNGFGDSRKSTKH